MRPTSKFEILRRKSVLNASGTFTSPSYSLVSEGTETAPRGLALGPHPTNPEAFDVAYGDGNGYLGHLTRRVVKGGLTEVERLLGRVDSQTPIGHESPFKDGEEVSVERAEEFEAEGPDLILTSGTGAIDETTPVGTPLSFYHGKVRAAQANDTVYFTLSANNLDPVDDGNEDLRIRCVAVA